MTNSLGQQVSLWGVNNQPGLRSLPDSRPHDLDMSWSPALSEPLAGPLFETIYIVTFCAHIVFKKTTIRTSILQKVLKQNEIHL